MHLAMPSKIKCPIRPAPCQRSPSVRREDGLKHRVDSLRSLRVPTHFVLARRGDDYRSAAGYEADLRGINHEGALEQILETELNHPCIKGCFPTAGQVALGLQQWGFTSERQADPSRDEKRPQRSVVNVYNRAARLVEGGMPTLRHLWIGPLK